MNSSRSHIVCSVLSGEVIEIGKGRIIRGAGCEFIDNSSSTRGKERKDRVAILSFGTRLHEALTAADDIEEANPDVSVTVADARFMKPLDVDLVRKLADDNGVVITVEEGSIGGFGDHVMHFLSQDGLLDNGDLKFRSMVMPDEYFETATQHEQYDQAKLNAEHIVELAMKLAPKALKKAVPVAEEVEA